MRRAKLQKIFGVDCHRWRFTAHAKRSESTPSEVDVSVTEKDDGTIIIEVERSTGKVIVLAGKIVLALNDGDHFKLVDDRNMPTCKRCKAWLDGAATSLEKENLLCAKCARETLPGRSLPAASCACHHGFPCTVVHDPSKCPCNLCCKATAGMS